MDFVIWVSNLSDFTSHLEELRRRMMLAFFVFLSASAVCYFFSHPILDFLTLPLRQQGHTDLFFQKPYEAFLLHVKAAAFSGLLISSPWLIIQGWLFVSPGLYESEKKLFLPLSAASVALFLAGAAFAFYIVVPFGLNFLLSYQTENLRPMLNAGAYFSFLVTMVLGLGIFFDFPVILAGLVMLGVLKTAVLVRSRKIIVVLIVIAAAVLTPSPDPFSQLLLAIPLWLLFEVSLFVTRILEKKRQKPEPGAG